MNLLVEIAARVPLSAKLTMVNHAWDKMKTG